MQRTDLATVWVSSRSMKETICIVLPDITIILLGYAASFIISYIPIRGCVEEWMDSTALYTCYKISHIVSD